MAALFRVLYPNATQGAVSSSSVLFPKLDLWGYFFASLVDIKRLEYSVKMEEVINETSNTVKDCNVNVAAAFQELLKSGWTKDGRTAITNALK